MFQRKWQARRSGADIAKSGMTSTFRPIEHASRRYVLALLLAYPVLAIAGALTHRQIFPLLALLLLLTVLMLPRLLSHRAGPWLIWLGLLAALSLASLHGYAGLLLESVPILVNALLAYWFGRTLFTPEPLVARFIIAIEGADRLTQPGVGRYARQVTWFWTLLLLAQALLLAVLLVFAEHAGLLARFGLVSPLRISDRWAAMWLHAGGYALLGAAFLLEYGYRRWRLRHLSHPGLHDMLVQLALHWPQLLRGNGAAAS
ncbi:MAG TPA: xanthomonadin biosynthesis protein [Rhodanobacter sp.]